MKNFITIFIITGALSINTNALSRERRTVQAINTILSSARHNAHELEIKGRALEKFIEEKRAIFEYAVAFGSHQDYVRLLRDMKALKEHHQGNPIYEICSERSIRKLMTEYDNLLKINCTTENLKFITKEMEFVTRTAQLAEDIITRLKNIGRICGTSNEAMQPSSCVNNKISKATAAYENFYQQYQNAMERMDLFYKKMIRFPCSEDNVNKFFIHSNTIRDQAHRCARYENLDQLTFNVTAYDLV